MTDRQCPSCGGFCKKSGCERDQLRKELAELRQEIDAEPVKTSIEQIAGAISKHITNHLWQREVLAAAQYIYHRYCAQQKSEPVQEQVAWTTNEELAFLGECENSSATMFNFREPEAGWVPLYAAPKQDGLRKAAQMALEALENSQFDDTIRNYQMQSDAIRALRKELE